MGKKRLSAETEKATGVREPARSMVMQENEFLKLCPGRFFDTVKESKVAAKEKAGGRKLRC